MSCVKLEDLKHQYPYVKLHVNDKDKVIQEEIDNSYRNDSDPACLLISLKDTE